MKACTLVCAHLSEIKSEATTVASLQGHGKSQLPDHTPVAGREAQSGACLPLPQSGNGRGTAGEVLTLGLEA